MGWWKADPVPSPPPPPPPLSQAPHPIPSNPASSSPADACPVDAQTRSIWLEQAAAQQKKSREAAAAVAGQQQKPLPHPNPSTIASPQECSSDRVSQSPSTEDPAGRSTTRHNLSHEREISSIPRAQSPSSTSPAPSTPANAETETGASPSGHWIYPSETQFYNAVLRKKTSSASPNELASTMPSVIPIHNAVNERAWSLIKSWEGQSSARCGGPKLLSFRGLGAGALSPKARVKSLAGYTAPFDRHDWVVQRCGGETVEYVIDFYQGKPANDAAAGRGAPVPQQQQLNFYLDVRPKLNSVEGCKMRFERFVGWR
ncbi:hypothetical protein LTR84_001905 [Exophiala bonariae]|uniref:Holocytochrome c-type synthase n=1 Tax=Exophiala bonariae TaxID=1690606 RepID=A0AAV9NBT7_9EURO|nr:hypothetical protein LTR84_001905 [Exophiala bonariae]